MNAALHQTGKPPPCLLGNNSPLAALAKLTAWSAHLASHPDVSFSSYILEGIESGFRIGYNYSARRRSASHNLLSSIERPEVIHSYLLKEQENGRIIGPLDSSSCPPVHCSPFGVIPKKGKGTWRMIIDLSSPKGMSINDGIDETWSSLSYVTVDMAAAKIRQLGPGTQWQSQISEVHSD